MDGHVPVVAIVARGFDDMNSKLITNSFFKLKSLGLKTLNVCLYQGSQTRRPSKCKSYTGMQRFVTGRYHRDIQTVLPYKCVPIFPDLNWLLKKDKQNLLVATHLCSA